MLDPRRGRVVVAASDDAMACGLRPQMPLVEARSLLQQRFAWLQEGAGQAHPTGQAHQAHQADQARQAGGPEKPSPSGVVVCQYDPAADRAGLRQLAEVLSLQISPLVALEPLEKARWAGQLLHQPQALLLDVSGIGELFGDEQKLLQQTASLLDQQGFSAQLAITSSVGSAWAIAHYGSPHSGRRQHGCLTWLVPAGETETALAELPVIALRIAVDAAEKLHRLGIRRVDELLRLPRSGLATRLGSGLLQRIDQALGTVDQTLPVHHAAAEDVVSTDLEYPTYATDLLKHRIEQLVKQLAAGLASRQQGALRLTCRLDLQAHQSQRMQLGLFAPTADADHLTGLLHSVFEQQRLTARVHRIVLAAPLTGPLRMHQRSLLTAHGGEGQGDAAALAKLIDGLSGRLGGERVLGVRRSSNPLPEQAFQTSVLTGRRAQRNAAASNTRSRETRASDTRAGADRPPTLAAEIPLRRPLDLLRQPQPIEASQLHRDGWPQQIKLRRWPAAQGVNRAWGPERIETGWWQGPSIRRDYFRLETEAGQWLWVYRQLGQNSWWLHGWFG
ncbi:DNA polymerase IV [Roseimaritima ulvae]|uniref:DNA polymerase IV n=2 Tax=Roseimaritima ulvae TaxID=980254 RepID=A0A5B9QT67_9BACT|nr:DNA polymerase IV [Roseimaritima ulvae]